MDPSSSGKQKSKSKSGFNVICAALVNFVDCGLWICTLLNVLLIINIWMFDCNTDFDPHCVTMRTFLGLPLELAKTMSYNFCIRVIGKKVTK